MRWYRATCLQFGHWKSHPREYVLPPLLDRLSSAHGEASTRRVIGFTVQRGALDIRIGNFEKVEISDFRSDAFCFLAHAAPDYLPVLTNWMQSPWFLKL